MIPITKPFLPPREKYDQYIDEVWQRNWLTNFGPLSTELERRLKEYLGSEYLLFLTNGTIAIQLALKALELSGEVITTPFSYVATTSSLVWEGCQPVFVDISANDLNVDPNLIEAAITAHTTAILLTHVYGNPCDIDRIEAIANKYGLKVIYDAAHCFGTTYRGQSVYNFGDVSTASFHATKLFHTIEGGAVFSKEKLIYDRMSYMRNFGHNGPTAFQGVGINAKNSEFHAAMGLCNLDSISDIMARRKRQYTRYEKALGDCGELSFITINPLAEFNYAYCPIIFSSEEKLLLTLRKLNGRQIFPRRYFYPSLGVLDYVEKDANIPVCESIASKVLCLPMYHELSDNEQQMVIDIILANI